MKITFLRRSGTPEKNLQRGASACRTPQLAQCAKLALTLTLSCLLLSTATATAQTNERVSLRYLGTEDNGDDYYASVSFDGQIIAFRSNATDLVNSPPDTNSVRDIFVRDLTAGTTTRVNMTTAGAQAIGGNSDLPSISADGRYVAFQSEATNLVTGDTNGASDVFVHDRVTGETTRISVDSSEVQGNAGSFRPIISRNGRYVAFDSVADNLAGAPDTNFQSDVFVRDRLLGMTALVSVDSSEVPGNSRSLLASMSTNGQFVVFQSASNNLVDDDANGRRDVFVRDLVAGETFLVSRNSAGELGNENSMNWVDPVRSGDISDDGRWVAFVSQATNLVAGDTNGVHDIFLRDRQEGTTTRMNVRADGVEANYYADYVEISPDGRYVTFTSSAGNLRPDPPHETNGYFHIWQKDRRYGTLQQISLDEAGVQAGGDSYWSSSTPDGNRVAFHSPAANLVLDDTNGETDIFLRTLSCSEITDLTAGTWKLISLPCENSSTIADMFGSQGLGTYGVDWAIVRRDAAGDVYYRVLESESLTHGSGYWIKALGSDHSLVLDGTQTDTSTYYDVSLEIGSVSRTANLVGNPFNFAFDWADALFVDGGTEYTPAEAEAAGLADRTMHLWNGGGYDPHDDVTPGMEGTVSYAEGFWVFARQNVTLRMPTKPEFADPAASKAFMIEQKSKWRRSRRPKEWYVRIIASGDGMRDQGNVFGQLMDSVKGQDPHDLAELPPFGNKFLTVVFPHPEWEDGGNYASDFHYSRRQRPDQWHFEVHSDDQDRKVTLEFEGPEEVLDRVTIRDLETRRRYRLKHRNHFTFRMTSDTRRFVIDLR